MLKFFWFYIFLILHNYWASFYLSTFPFQTSLLKTIILMNTALHLDLQQNFQMNSKMSLLNSSNTNLKIKKKSNLRIIN